ncbi:GNAT family N-acetyltransferase [Lysinibacillus piscis]|uniref:N-acetyltransferase domain-containing protein n=1 Tax=Lysinibacillus piscis TaxID=2518931 RepID=A0ABQ5NMY4_9BACI|nr:GNAT family protein [Lysinibacillus sp. KH24]GLC89389.1 hypothetical protein LYSBPC_25160 [Lysinibacillus sp. KH24]
MIIEKLQQTDTQQLYEFELENRDYFEQLVPSRGQDYYHFDNFLIQHATLLEEQAQGQALYYLIKDHNGFIMGRLNVVDIDGNTAHIGYRIAEAYSGQGIASQALALLLTTIHQQGIQQLLAKTTNNNIASQKILEKNGFQLIETNEDTFEMHGQPLHFVYYQWKRHPL